jgi:hypothetical protein
VLDFDNSKAIVVLVYYRRILHSHSHSIFSAAAAATVTITIHNSQFTVASCMLESIGNHVDALARRISLNLVLIYR